MKRLKAGVLMVMAVVLVLVFSRTPAWAHHGTAAFDTSAIVTVTAKVTEFMYVNPHVQVYFEGKTEKGEVSKWQGELTAPNKLTRAGWSKNTLKPGDSITVSGFQLKNGKHTMWIRKLIGPDGAELPLFED